MRIALAASLVSFAIALIGCGGPAESQQSEASSPAATARTAPLAMGTDWPRFLGPNQDSVSTEKGIIAPWPKQGLDKVWECSLGLGYTPPIISGGKLFHFDRFDDNCRLT